ncbi:MAG: hypothetical protein U0Y68_07825 [Blastocatellia bacterium]
MVKRTFILLLTTLSLCAALHAQPNPETVLAAGNPPLTQALADQMQLFFEWALDGKFTTAQRKTLNQLLIQQWQTDTAASRQETLKLMAVPRAANQLSAADRQLVHDKFQAALLQQIKNQPDNELSKLLTSVQQSKNANDPLNRVSSSPVAPKAPAPAPATNAHAQFAGEWLYRIRGSNITYTNGRGGYADASGELSGYKLHPDGTYEHGYLLSSSLYGCNTKVFGYETGTWTVEGDKLVFLDKTASLTSKDNCNASGNYEKKLPLRHYYYQFRVERDEYGLKLAFLKTDGTNDPYYKQAPGQMGW